MKIAHALKQLRDPSSPPNFNDLAGLLRELNLNGETINTTLNQGGIFATMAKSLNNANVEEFFVNRAGTEEISKRLE